MSDSISALLSKTAEEVTEVLQKHLETFQILTEMNHSTASLELSIKGKLQQFHDDLPLIEDILLA